MLLSKEMKEVKISVVTVNFNVTKNINKLIKSLLLINSVLKEIIVIDNNSTDSHKIKTTNKTRIVFNKSNLGFAKAVNQGIKIAKSDFILLINPDCYLENKTIIKTLKIIIKDDEIGAIGGKIRKANSNKYQMTANNKVNFMIGMFEFTNLKRIFPNNYFSRKFWAESSIIKFPKQVESLCGAYMIIRRKIDNKLNLFDERYFLYMEDIDFGNRVNSLGYKVIFDPRSEITHIGGASSNSKYNIVLNQWYKSRKIYFYKHLNIIASTILNLIFVIEEILLTTIRKFYK